MNNKTIPAVFFVVALQIYSLEAYAAKSIQEIAIPAINFALEEVKLDCSEFKPNLVTKFIWKEGPTRASLYKKCLDQTQDDEAFTKYNETMINDSNIKDLSVDLKEAKTRLTILTLTTALKNYLTDPTTNEDKMDFIKSALEGFKQHYIEKRAMLDVEIKEMKRKENPKNKKTAELLRIIDENEEDLGNSIDSTIRYMEFVVKDRNAYVAAHNKFLPHMYVNPKSFKKSRLSKYECEFLELNFGDEWSTVKKDLQLTCLKR